jgi:hypothetical protein
MVTKTKAKAIIKKAGSKVNNLIKKSPIKSQVLKPSPVKSTLSKVKGTVGKVAGGLSSQYLGINVVEEAKVYAKQTGTTQETAKKEVKKQMKAQGIRIRHKSLVPKSVKKWVNRTHRRRKTEEKTIKKMVSGMDIIKKANAKSKGHSFGVITKEEARQALKM